MGFNDVIQRYRGSILGPFWITMTTAVFIVGIGAIYSGLFGASSPNYVPWISNGFVIWTFIATVTTEGADAFIGGSHILRQSATPVPVFLWRVVFRNLINLLHQAPVVLAVALWYGFLLKINLPLFIAGLALVIVNMSWIALLCALLSTRFRDVPQVIQVLMQLIFLMSPVLWIPNGSARVGAVARYNLVSYMLDATRNPLLGRPVPLHTWAILAIAAVAGWLAALAAYANVRRRVVHYL